MVWMRSPKLHTASVCGGSGLSDSGCVDSGGGDSGSSAKTDLKKFMTVWLRSIWRKVEKVYELWILRMVIMVGGCVCMYGETSMAYVIRF